MSVTFAKCLLRMFSKHSDDIFVMFAENVIIRSAVVHRITREPHFKKTLILQPKSNVEIKFLPRVFVCRVYTGDSAFPPSFTQWLEREQGHTFFCSPQRFVDEIDMVYIRCEVPKKTLSIMAAFSSVAQ